MFSAAPYLWRPTRRRRTVQSLATGILVSGCLTAFAGSFTSNFSNPNQAGITLNGGQNGAGNNYPIIQNGKLLMTYNETSENNSTAVLDDLDAGKPIESFTATFNLQLGPGSSPPADGFSFNFGPDINSSSALTEEGAGGAGDLVVEFDTYLNTGTTPPDNIGIDVKVGGNEVATSPMDAATLVDGQSHPVFIQLNNNGTLNVSWNNQVIYTNLFLPGWAPINGQFALGARTGGSSEECDVSNLSITTTVASGTAKAPTITTQPQNQTVAEGAPATFSVGFSGSAPVTIQWSRNGTDIPNATNGTYTLSSTSLADTGAKFHAKVTNSAGNATSNDATLTVNVLQPFVVGATAFPGSTKVGLMFNKNLDLTTAQNTANYKVNGAAVTSVLVRTNVANELTHESNLVQLTIPTAVNSDFTVAVSGVKDFEGNALAQTNVTGKIINLTSTDLGSPADQPGGPDPLFPSVVTTWGPGAFDVYCNGNDYWYNADGFNFLWEPKTNNFDVKVRVVSVSPTDNWSAGAIEVREGPPTANGKGWELARHYFIKTDYGGPDPSLHGTGNGANAYEFNCRLAPGDPTKRETSNDAPGGSVGTWGTGGTGAGNPGPPPYPNAWIRIARVKGATNDLLRGYWSTNGVNWELRREIDLNDENHAGFLDLNGNPAGKWPDVCYVGLGSTSHTGVGNQPQDNDGSVGETWYSPVGKPFGCYVIYRDWGDVAAVTPPPGGGPTLSFAENADGSLTLTYMGTLYSSDTVNGKFTPIAGATSPYKVTPKSSGKTATFFEAGP